jgi:hypothetical protein
MPVKDPAMRARRHTDAELEELYATTGIDLTELSSVLTAAELAPILRTSVGALAQDRYRLRGVPHVVVGKRRIRYLRADVCRYLLANRSGGAA